MVLNLGSLHNSHEARISCLGLSADGSALCSGSWDTNLKVSLHLDLACVILSGFHHVHHSMRELSPCLQYIVNPFGSAHLVLINMCKWKGKKMKRAIWSFSLDSIKKSLFWFWNPVYIAIPFDLLFDGTWNLLFFTCWTSRFPGYNSRTILAN